MSDFLPDDYEFEEELASMFTLEKLDTMIRTCSLQNKAELTKRLEKITESEAIELMNYLREYMPRFNTEAIAHDIKEQGEAIRNAVLKDDFYDRRYKK